MKLIYFGVENYIRSGTAVGSIYTKQGARSDWGAVSNALLGGEKVTIRPATKKEHTAMERLTTETIARLKADGFGGPWGSPRKAKSAKGGAK